MHDFEDKPELNITPLVDVMLVLLAILMLAMPAVVYQEKIDLPQGSKKEENKEKEKITVRVDLQKIVYVNDKKFDSATFAPAFLELSATLDKASPVSLRADKNLKYDDVMNVMRAIKAGGFLKISLVTDG